MLKDNMPWDNDDFDLDDNEDLLGALDINGDGIEDTEGYYVDTDGDKIADVYTEIGEFDIDGDGDADYFVELTDDDLDGVIDVQKEFMDQDNDGIIDIEYGREDTDGDGWFDIGTQSELRDTNQDGIGDTIYEFQDTGLDGSIDIEKFSEDVDGDGYFDRISENVYVDTNQDGVVDIISFRQDENADGYFDVFTVAQDLDFDGIFDSIIDSQNSMAPENNVPIYDPSEDSGMLNFDPDTADASNIIGDPGESMEYWHVQETNSSCAVAAQEFVLEDLLHRDFSEEELRDFAEENGWYSEYGTPINDVGNILEAFGLNVERYEGGTIDDITNCLENGGNVIIGVDADEIWYGDNDIFGPGDDANHALEVIGIDYSDPDNPMVILNDSGHPEGCGSMVPLDQFMDAWEDSGCFMVEAYN